jgi:hypothetical protein
MTCSASSFARFIGLVCYSVSLMVACGGEEFRTGTPSNSEQAGSTSEQGGQAGTETAGAGDPSGMAGIGGGEVGGQAGSVQQTGGFAGESGGTAGVGGTSGTAGTSGDAGAAGSTMNGSGGSIGGSVCGPWEKYQLFTNLDDKQTTMTPLVGSGFSSFTSLGSDNFHNSPCQKAGDFSANGAFVHYRETVQFPSGEIFNHINYQKGGIRFRYQPFYQHIDGQAHHLFTNSNNGTRGGIQIEKSKDNALTLYAQSLNSKIAVYKVMVDQYEWLANEWVDLAFDWDFSNPNSQVRISVNKNQFAPPSSNASFPTNLPMINTDEFIVIGAWNNNDGNPPNGLIDSFGSYLPKNVCISMC